MQDFGGISGNDSGSLRSRRFSAEDGGYGGGTDYGPAASALGLGQLLLAETLGLAMARRAADILDRNRDSIAQLAGAGPGDDEAGEAGPSPTATDARQFALDDAIFTAVLDAANDCLGRFDSRPPAERWCDALLHLLDLARYAGNRL